MPTSSAVLTDSRLTFLVCGESSDTLRAALAEYNAKPYSPKVARCRAAIVRELLSRGAA